MKRSLVFFSLLGALVLTTPMPAFATSSPAAPPASVLVNVNTATVSELEKLPGIGRTTAQNIVNYRADKGKFSTLDDLLNVKGIGPKTLEKIRGMIAL